MKFCKILTMNAFLNGFYNGWQVLEQMVVGRCTRHQIKNKNFLLSLSYLLNKHHYVLTKLLCRRQENI